MKVAAEALGRKLSNNEQRMPVRLAFLAAHKFHENVTPAQMGFADLIGGGERFLD